MERIPRTDFDVREVWSGAWIGALAGIVFSGFVAAAICYLVDIAHTPGDLLKLSLLMHVHLALAGAVAGATIALLIGLAIPRLSKRTSPASRTRCAALLLLGSSAVAILTLAWIVLRRPTTLANAGTAIPPLLAEATIILLALRALSRERDEARSTGGARTLWLVAAAAFVAPAVTATLRSVTFAQPVQADVSVAHVAPLAERVLLVGWDGATWDVIDPLLRKNEMPNLAKLIAAGTRATLPARAQQIQPLANSASAGMRTPALWETISTGKGPEMHGVWDFESKIVLGLDQALPFRVAGNYLGVDIPTTSDMARSERVWQILDRAGVSAAVVGWYSLWPIRRPLEHGVIVSDRTGDKVQGAIAPADEAALEDRCSKNSELQRHMGIDPDPPLLEPRVEADLIRTIDHDLRDDICYAGITLDLIARRHPAFIAPYFSLTDIAQHKFWRFYQPQAFGDVDARLIERYGDVIPAAYRYLDSVLGELVAAAGPQTTVILVSDHGGGPWTFFGLERLFSGALQSYHPDYSGNHRSNGIIMMSGPAVRTGATLSDPQQVDVAPTILALFGIAPSRDMRGRVLTEALVGADTAPVARVASYQTEDTVGSLRPTPSGADEHIEERLKALGYIQ